VAAGGWTTFGGGGARLGSTPAAVGVPRTSWFASLPGTITTQPLAVTGVPRAGGVTGTPVADPATRSLYVADAFGRLHALDLATGAERPGWPVVLYRDARRELVWATRSSPTAACTYPPVRTATCRWRGR